MGQKTYQKRLAFFGGTLVIEFTRLDDFPVDIELELSPLQYLFFDRVGGDETQNQHLLLLANTMSTILGLKILMRIPGD